MLGNLSGSFSSSGSLSGSLDSPLRERSSTWGFVEVPPAIAENQTPSDAGNSAESGFHDMSRQASKTESSESAADCAPNEQALEELIRQSAEYGESETSRSSSDTITPEEHICEEGDQSKGSGSPKNSQGNSDSVSDNQSSHSHDNDSAESSVFEENSPKFNLQSEEQLRGINTELSMSAKNYDTDFPPALKADSAGFSDLSSDKLICDVNKNSSNQEPLTVWSKGADLFDVKDMCESSAENVDSSVVNVDKSLGDTSLSEGSIQKGGSNNITQAEQDTESLDKDVTADNIGEEKVQESEKDEITHL